MPSGSITSSRKMVPADTVSLVGMRMEQLKSTPLFQKLVAQGKFQPMDQFVRESGFDPRRDVRDLLLASNGKQTVLLARGSFHLNLPPAAKKIDYHGYAICYWAEQGGFCILDSTLAAAGPLPVLEAALDQYKSGARNNASVLLTRARSIPEDYQLWVVTAGNGSLISENMPGAAKGLDVGRIFRSLQNVLLEVDLRKGIKGFAEGYCPSAQDAKSLSDAARGMVGMARLEYAGGSTGTTACLGRHQGGAVGPQGDSDGGCGAGADGSTAEADPNRWQPEEG